MPPRPQPRALRLFVLSLCGLALLAGCRGEPSAATAKAVAEGQKSFDAEDGVIEVAVAGAVLETAVGIHLTGEKADDELR